MKRLLQIVVIILFASNAHGQYFTVTNTTGTVLYGATNVTVTSAGTASATPWCGVNPYWIGAGSGTIPAPGSYTFSFSPPISAVRLYASAMDYHAESTLDSEKIAIAINGVPYFLTPANFTVWAGTCGQPAAAVIYGELRAVADLGAGAGGQLDVTAAMISTCTVSTNGIYNGSTFTFEFISGPTNNGPLCAGDTLKLFWNGDSTGATYYWYGPGGFTSTLQDPVIPAATIADSGLYHVVKTIGAIHDTGVTRVIIKPIPVLIVTSNSPICQGATNTLNLFAGPDSTGETFSWTGPNTFSSTLVNPTFTGFVAADTGIYRVIANWNGCLDTGYTHVILAPVPPAPVISGITTYCTGQTFVPFTVTGTGSILWYATGTGGVGSPTPPTVNTSYGGTYTFWATQTILGCESLRDSITVTVHVTPAPPVITGASVYCQYFPYIPPSAAGTNILWYTTATGGTGNIIVPTINTNIAGVYTIYATQSDSGCESPRGPFTITVNPKPAPPVIIDSPGNYCPGQTFIPFRVVSGAGILWYATATGGIGNPVSPIMNTTIPGPQTVWASQTVLGCESDRAPVTITVYDSVTSGFTYILKYGCKADTILLTNTSTQSNVFLWDFGDGNSSILKNPTHIYTRQGIDTVRLFSGSATCLDSSKHGINHLHPIHAQFTADTNLVCQGSTVSFTDVSVGTTLNYLWNFGDGNTATINNPSHFYPHTGIYKVAEIVTDFVPCHDTAYETISVDTISPIHIAITDTVICMGTITTFTGNYASIGNTGITWNLGNGDSIKNRNPLTYGYGTTGTFTITATALYRVCPDPSVSHTVTVLPSPQINLGPDTTICKGGVAISLSDKINAGNPQATWLWNTGQTTPAISVAAPGTYSATVKIDGCTASGSVKVSNDCYMDIPNVFTPNGDGLNDYFYPRQYLTGGLTSFKMNIYNRWGMLIFETTSLDGSGWDGKFNNVDQPVGVYVYVIDGTFKDGQKEHHQGNVTLLR